MSIHGESVSNGSGSSGSCRMSSAQIICVHVVPHFGGVLMMMSPGAKGRAYRDTKGTEPQGRSR
jgi:hypothetical protein